jgi:hypothetical protein
MSVGNFGCRLQVFDITRKVTYTNLSKWYAELQENRPSIPCIVVANKIDRKLSSTFFVPNLNKLFDSFDVIFSLQLISRRPKKASISPANGRHVCSALFACVP